MAVIKNKTSAQPLKKVKKLAHDHETKKIIPIKK